MKKEEEEQIKRLIDTGNEDNINLAFNLLLAVGFDKPNAVLKTMRPVDTGNTRLLLSETVINGLYFEISMQQNELHDRKLYIHIHNEDHMVYFDNMENIDVWRSPDMVGTVSEMEFMNQAKQMFVESAKHWGELI